MKIYNEEKIMKYKNVLIVITLTLLSIFLFFKVYGYFENAVKIIMSTTLPFVLSFMIVYSLMPFIDILNKNYKIKRSYAITIVLSIFFLMFTYIILAFIPLIMDQIKGLAAFFVRNQHILQKNMIEFFESSNINIHNTLINSKVAIMNTVLKILNSSFSWLSGMFSLFFMTPIFTIMLIYSYDNIGVGMKKFLKRVEKEELIPLIKEIDDAIGRYIKVTVLDSFLVGVASYIIFLFLKMEYSILFSLIIGIGNIIPFIGPFIGLVPAVLFAFTKSWKLVVAIIVLITILQTIEGNIIKPWLTSKSVDMHPITTLLVVLIGGGLFGIGGALLSIPIYIVIKLVILYKLKLHDEND